MNDLQQKAKNKEKNLSDFKKKNDYYLEFLKLKPKSIEKRV